MHREHLWNGGPYRVTCHINRRPAVNIHHAARYSELIGLPLNYFVTVNFTLTECSPDCASHTFRKMLAQRFAPWMRRTVSNTEVVKPTYVWTLEAGGRQFAAHWLLHLPFRRGARKLLLTR
jgi:hypothetical protein